MMPCQLCDGVLDTDDPNICSSCYFIAEELKLRGKVSEDVYKLVKSLPVYEDICLDGLHALMGKAPKWRRAIRRVASLIGVSH